MSRRTRQLGLVILVQTGCVAIGLWMENQYVKSSIRRAAEEAAWSDIEAYVRNLQSQLSTLTTDGLHAGNTDLHYTRDRLGANHPLRGGAMIVDGTWTLLVQAEMGPEDQETALKPGDVVTHTRVKEPADDTVFGARFSLAMADGPHIAAAGTLPGSTGYIVVHRPVADVSAESAALVRSLPALSGVTLLWLSALLGFVIYLVVSRFHDDVDRERKALATDAVRRTQNLVRTRDAVIFGLAQLADSRDPETGDHLERISIYSTTLATALQRHPKFRDDVTPSFVRLIGISSALHDIGKVGIEDAILRKAGSLTPTERVRMQTHTTIGGECLREIEQRLGSSNFLQMAREIAFAHHERWDGSGYPNGLAREAIPLSARIVSIVDVYDALSSRRVYKPPLPHDECMAVIQSQSGKHFDPELVEVWMNIAARFREVAAQYTGAASEPVAPKTRAESGEIQTEIRKETLVTAVLAGER